MSTLVQAERPSTLQIYSFKNLWLIALCFVLSGATGLIYEVLWARMLGLVFGATTLAVSTVLAAFMGGLALGSAWAGRIAIRIKRPIRAYGLVEIGIALYALAVPFLFRWVDNLYALIWQHFQPGFYAFSLWRFVLSCATLLIPTTLMGATLPVLSAALLRSPVFRSTSVTRLYTCNLTGAILGTVAAGFFLLPTLGVRATVYTAAAINIMIGLIAVAIDRRAQVENFRHLAQTSAATQSDLRDEETRVDELPAEAQADGLPRNDTRFWLVCAFVSGFVTISTQVAWTRVLTMIIGSSTYAFSIVVALFLIGLSGGAYLVGRMKADKLRATVLKFELITALSIFFSIRVVNHTPALLVNTGLRFNISSWGGLLALQVMSAALLILLPAFLMGTIMPLVLVWASKARSELSVHLVGRCYAVNTVGAIAGAFCAGFILIPRASTRFTILLAAGLCLLIAGWAFQPKPNALNGDVHRSLAVGCTAALIVGLFVVAPGLNLEDLSVGAFESLVRVLAKSRSGVKDDAEPQSRPEAHQLLMYEEGPTSTVSVRRDWWITSMAINGRTNASDSEDMATQIMLGQAPLLLAPRTNKGLIVGFASGVSVGAMLQSPVGSVECVELERATVNGSRFFEHVNNRPLNDSRLRLIIDDARTYLRVTPTRYDMIVSEPNHPWVPGVANLFTKEFFDMGRDRLAPDGVFVQWLQIYQLSTESLRSVLATYKSVFPHVMVFRVGGVTKGKDLILVGSRAPLTLDRLAERLGDSRIAAELSRVGIKNASDVRSWYVCDEMHLVPAVAGAVINTDDNMHIETTVPREAFLPLMQTNAAWIESLANKQ